MEEPTEAVSPVRTSIAPAMAAILEAAADGELCALLVEDARPNGYRLRYTALVRAGEGFDPQNTMPQVLALVLDPAQEYDFRPVMVKEGTL